MASLEPKQPPSDEDGNVIVVPINREFSDGTQNSWPTDPKFRMTDDTAYRRKLAAKWIEENGAYEPGMEYIIDAMPENYVMFDRPRGTNPDIRDRFLYGHPCGQYFDSTIKFYPHFYYLMTGGTQPCTCVNCGKLKSRENYVSRGGRGSRGRPPGSFSGKHVEVPIARESPRPIGRPRGRPSGKHFGEPTARPVGRPPGRPSGRGRPPGRSLLGRTVGRPPRIPVVDREGNPDVYKMAIKNLRNQGTLDQAITEEENMDWRAEKALLEEHLEQITIQQAYIPRLGEIVLWTPSLEGELRWNSETERIEVYSPTKGKFLGIPEWRAGIVSQVPREDVTIYDLAETSAKQWEVNYSGFRVETYPDPLSTDKSYSLHYKYVHLKCIKPFNAFEVFLQKIPREQFHPSIEYAMTVMSSFSLLNKQHFKGTWPNASIYCQAMFLGAELLLVGDAVRLKPKGCTMESALDANITDVLVIDEIRLDLIDCDDDIKSEQIAGSYRVRIRGKIYTNSPLRASTASKSGSIRPLSKDRTISAFLYTGMSGYGDWYRLHPGTLAEVSQDMIIGRCYEPDAMQILFGSLSISRDLHGVLMGREYSRQTDERIAEGKHWFWGDYRTQTLAIDSLNGEDVGQYSDARNAKMWRANLKVLDGKATVADIRDARLPGELGRPSTKARSNFSEVRKTSTLVSTGLGATDASNNVSSESAEEDESEFEREALSKYISGGYRVRGGTEETDMGDYNPEGEKRNAGQPLRRSSGKAHRTSLLASLVNNINSEENGTETEDEDFSKYLGYGTEDAEMQDYPEDGREGKRPRFE